MNIREENIQTLKDITLANMTKASGKMETKDCHLLPALLLSPPKLFPDPPNFLELMRLLAAPTDANGFFNILMTPGPAPLPPPLKTKCHKLSHNVTPRLSWYQCATFWFSNTVRSNAQ